MQPTKVRREGGSIVRWKNSNGSPRRVARKEQTSEEQDTNPTRPEPTSSFNPDGYAHASIKPNSQSPVADPHASIGGLRKFQTFIQPTDTLQEHQYPCDNDLIQSHGILRLGQRCQVAPERLIEKELRKPCERAHGGYEIEGAKPTMRHLQSGKCVEWTSGQPFGLLALLARAIGQEASAKKRDAMSKEGLDKISQLT